MLKNFLFIIAPRSGPEGHLTYVSEDLAKSDKSLMSKKKAGRRSNCRDVCINIPEKISFGPCNSRISFITIGSISWFLPINQLYTSLKTSKIILVVMSHKHGRKLLIFLDILKEPIIHIRTANVFTNIAVNLLCIHQFKVFRNRNMQECQMMYIISMLFFYFLRFLILPVNHISL